jgi:uncharacterized protein (UPF0276 family)
MGKRINFLSKISIDLEYVNTEAATGPFLIKSKKDTGRKRVVENVWSSFRVILQINCICMIIVERDKDELPGSELAAIAYVKETYHFMKKLTYWSLMYCQEDRKRKVPSSQ